MKKYLQNHVAESQLTLVASVSFVALTFLAAGAVANQWWGQIACMAASVYMIVETSNHHTLLRVRSRMVSSTFAVLSACNCFLLGSLSNGIVGLCTIVFLYLLFLTYQDPGASGKTFYAYLFIGVASLFFVQIVFFLPLVWLLSAIHLHSLSWRTWLASLLGVATPYWLAVPWLLYRQDYRHIASHFHPLTVFMQPADYHSVTFIQTAVFTFVMLLVLVSIFHFLSRSFEDNIRTRQFYSVLLWTGFGAVVFLAFQPQHYDPLMRIIIICASPFIAHFFALTHSKFTNYLFIASCVVAVILTLSALYFSQLSSITDPALRLWNGLLDF